MTLVIPYVPAIWFPAHSQVKYQTIELTEPESPVQPDIIGQFQTSLPIDKTIEFCKRNLHAADFSVVQVGQSTLVGCKKGATSTSIKVILEKSHMHKTSVTYLLLP